MKYMYDDIGTALTYLEQGVPAEREKALTTIAMEKDSIKYYDLVWEVFLSDENFHIRDQALNICISMKPWKIFEIEEYISCYELRMNYWYRNNIVERALFEHLKLYKKDEFIRFLKGK